MQAGKLRHRVQLQAPIETRDDLGGVQSVWMTMDELWCNIEPLRGKEVFEAQSIEARLSHKITLRAIEPIDPRWRLVWVAMARAFQIHSVRDLGERHRTVEVLAMEIVN